MIPSPTPAAHAEPPASRVGSGRLLQRADLLARLAQAQGRTVVLIRAPAGCGKSSLLQLWRRALVVEGIEVAWATLGSDDSELARLFEDVTGALAAIDPEIAREARLLASRGRDDETVERVVIALVQGVARFGRAVTLVLDDAQNLHSEEAQRALELLIEYAPPNLRFAISTRSAQPHFLTRARAPDRILHLGLEDLRFSPAESAAFLRERLAGADDHMAGRLHELTGGWPAGLQLLCVDLWRKRAESPLQEARVVGPGTFASYLEEEVLARLGPDELRLMTTCAAPLVFNAALAAEMLGAPTQASTRCAAMLDRLADQGMFMTRESGDLASAWWRIHPLLRDVLRARFETWPQDERRRIHAAAWRWFAAQGLHRDSVRHAIAAGETAAAVERVESIASTLFVQGDLRQLVGLVRLLPRELVHERTSLRLWLAWVEVYERRLQDCARSIARLKVDMAGASAAERYRLTLLEGLLAVQRDDTHSASAILRALEQAPEGADGIALAGRRNILSWVYVYRGEYERARRMQLDEEPPLVNGQVLHGTPFGKLVGLCMVGLAHSIEGQMVQAERMFRDVLFEADQRGASCIDASCMAAGLLAEILYELNDPAGAARLVEERFDVLQRVSIPDTVVRVMLVMTRAYRLTGRPMDAFAHLEQVEDYAQRLGLDRVLAYAQLEAFKLHVALGEIEAARQCLARLEEVDARHAGVEAETLSEIAVAAARARIRLAMVDGDHRVALERIEALLELCRRRGRVRRIAYLHLQAAVVERRLGREEKARARTREALRIGHRLGLVRTLLDADDQALSLIEATAGEGGLDPLLAFYARRILASAQRDGPGAPQPEPARAASLEALSPRETEIVQLLLQAMPNKRIARALGVSLDTVKWHLKNVYGKLGATGRDDVVQRLRVASR